VPGTRSSSRSAASPEIKQAAAFRAALRDLLGRTEAATNRAGLTPQRYDLLLAIKGSGGESTINELCASLGMRQTAVTELVKRAQEAGLVTRSSSTVDRRVVLVRATPEADARFERCFAALTADRAGFADALELLKHTLDPPAPELHPSLEPPSRPELPS
jgi:DNA-binding MarR family transcriptional regulator